MTFIRTKLLLILVLSFFMCNLADAQIRGIVVNAKTKYPVEFADVYLLNTNDSSIIDKAIVDSLGHFDFNHPSNLGLLKISYKGYQHCYIDYTNDLGFIDLMPLAFNSTEEVTKKNKKMRRK